MTFEKRYFKHYVGYWKSKSWFNLIKSYIGFAKFEKNDYDKHFWKGKVIVSFLKGGSESNLVLRHSSFCAGHYVVYKNQKKTHCVSIYTTLIHSIWEGESRMCRVLSLVVGWKQFLKSTLDQSFISWRKHVL